MARDVGEGFKTFLDRLEPLSSESEKATKHRAGVKCCLENNFGCYGFTKTASIGNGTGVRHYSDTDYFASIPVKTLTNNSGYFLRTLKTALQGTFFSTAGINYNTAFD